MYPKVVLVVSRSHWRCISCKVHNKRTVSIDQHLQAAHPHLAFPSSHTSAASARGTCCHSDGELDIAFPSTLIWPLKTLSLEIRKNQLLGKECQVEKPTVTESRQFRQRPKRIHDRKSTLVQSAKTSQKHGNTVVNLRDGRHHSIDSEQNGQGLDENVGYDEPVATAEEKTDKQMRKLQTTLKKKSALSQMKQCFNHRRRKPSSVQTTLKDKNNGSVANAANSAPKKRPKRREQLHWKASEVARVKAEKSTAGDGGAKTTQSFKDKECAKLDRHDSRKWKQIDKSKIATSCVPWLLDAGRKAGEKVTKKSRRILMPEEKQAVRELYGVSVYDQTARSVHAQNFRMPVETNGQYDTGAQCINLEDSCLAHHSNPPVQRMNHEEDVALHRNFLMNVFSQGSHDFFMDSSRAHEQVYPSHGSAFSEHHHQNSLYTSQVADFYSPLQNIPSQRSDSVNFQPYTQNAAPVISTHGAGDCPQPQMDVREYSGQRLNMSSLSHSHAIPPPAIRPLPTIPAAMSVHPANYDVNADTVIPMPHSVVGCNVKSDPAAVAQTRCVDSARLNVPDGTTGMEDHCSVCKQTFGSHREFEKHQREVAAFDPVECKRCRSVFHGLHDLNLHVFSVHELEKQAFCFTCNTDITGVENLEKHVHRHVNDCERTLNEMRFHDCRLCAEELPSSYTTLRAHYYQHHVAHVCCECFQHFRDLTAYKEHCRTHNGSLFLCSICGIKFESVEDFDGHAPCPEDIWAEDGKGDMCLKCGVWCPNRAVVEAHRKQHRSQDDVQAYRQGAKIGFPCASCEKVFKNKHACRRHVKMVHQGVSCYKHYCEYCGKGFLTKGHMRDHIALHHLKIKRYSCDYCSQQFVCAPTLRRHVRKEHTKHKPYECQHCGERFFEKTPLQRHLTQHTGLAPFMCEHCGKGFYTKHSFTNHASTHSTVKEFVCSGCQKGFTRKYNLQAHMKICKQL